jgi:hypothetical protein
MDEKILKLEWMRKVNPPRWMRGTRYPEMDETMFEKKPILQEG